VREYLYAEEVAAFTPWSEEALDRLIQRGTLKAGVHFFQPTGHRGRRIFKRSAIVRLIEGQDVEVKSVLRAKMGTKGFDVEKAEERLRRLLG
jgi:hypothetical protein